MYSKEEMTKDLEMAERGLGSLRGNYELTSAMFTEINELYIKFRGIKSILLHETAQLEQYKFEEENAK